MERKSILILIPSESRGVSFRDRQWRRNCRLVNWLFFNSPGIERRFGRTHCSILTRRERCAGFGTDMTVGNESPTGVSGGVVPARRQLEEEWKVMVLEDFLGHLLVKGDWCL